MASVRPVRDRAGKITGYRVDAKRTFDDGEQTRWGRTFRAEDRSPRALEAVEAEAHEAGRLADADLRQDPPVHPADRYRLPAAPEPYSPGMTVRQWFEIWHPAKRRLSPMSVRSQTSLIDNHILPVLGWHALADLDRDDVQSWAWGLADDLMPRSQGAAYRILKAGINAAILDKRCPISSSPFTAIELERPDPTGRQALTVDQVAILARYARHTWPADHPVGYADIILSLAFTGLRSAEFCARDRHDLTLRRTIEVRGRDLHPEATAAPAAERPRPRKGKRGRRKAKATKSPAGARSVLLAPSFAAQLSASLAGHDSPALWVSRAGTRLTYSTLYKIVTKACADAIAAGEPLPPGITMHWLRKTLRTWLSEAHIPRVAVDEVLGHETPGMQGVYEEVTEAMRQQIRDVLEARYLEVTAALGKARRAS